MFTVLCSRLVEAQSFLAPSMQLLRLVFFCSRSWFTYWKAKEWSASLTHLSVVTYGQGRSLMEGESGLFWAEQSHATIEGCCIRDPTPLAWMESKVAEWKLQLILPKHFSWSLWQQCASQSLVSVERCPIHLELTDSGLEAQPYHLSGQDQLW